MYGSITGALACILSFYNGYINRPYLAGMFLCTGLICFSIASAANYLKKRD